MKITEIKGSDGSVIPLYEAENAEDRETIAEMHITGEMPAHMDLSDDAPWRKVTDDPLYSSVETPDKQDRMIDVSDMLSKARAMDSDWRKGDAIRPK